MKQSATITFHSVCLQTICVQCIYFNILLKGGGEGPNSILARFLRVCVSVPIEIPSELQSKYSLITFMFFFKYFVCWF